MSNSRPCACAFCGECVQNCDRCPTAGCEFVSIYNLNKMRINKQVRIAGSLQIFNKKVATVSRMVGQSATPTHLLQAGGPGDLISAVQGKMPRNANRFSLNRVTYNLGVVKNRLSCKGNVGVDKKHGSYARFLARKTGGVLRQEQMPKVRSRKASIHQPRTRTGFNVTCRPNYQTETKQFLSVAQYGDGVASISLNCPDLSGCCNARIPQVISNISGAKCSLTSNDANRWNSGNTTVTGACGNNTQCVSSSRCRCCYK